MKVISIWQPWATLIVNRFKIFETRTWAPPKSLLGQELGIAATKNILPQQTAAFNDPDFQEFYQRSGFPAMEELPRGMLLGSVTLDSFELITDEFLEDVSDEEQAYGWYHIGSYAWRFKSPKIYEHPIPIQGKQGIYDYFGFERNHQD